MQRRYVPTICWRRAASPFALLFAWQIACWGFRLSGTKLYSTGALFADYVSTIGQDQQGRRTVAVVPAGHPGMKIIDDWQRLRAENHGKRDCDFRRCVGARAQRATDPPKLRALAAKRGHAGQPCWHRRGHCARAAIDATIAFIRERDAASSSSAALPLGADP
ncbi:hypothetical protein [Paraburkholderia sp. JPY419]|uniref:hypothetical protein n=1 Tax=Paraburkholderia sp. JPY419 TaxID=667660 RepID=UPI003D255D6A